jgi:hypothetical protein
MKEAKVVHVRDIARCELCERRADHACISLHHEVRAAVSEWAGRMARHGEKTPEVEVVVDCHSFWRLGRGHGNQTSHD